MWYNIAINIRIGGQKLAKKYISKQNAKIDFSQILRVLPLVLTIAIIPLIVYLKVIPPTTDTVLFTNGKENLDFFSYNKMLWLLIFTGIGALMYLGRYITYRQKPLVKSNVYYPMAAYIILSVASTLFATYKRVAFFGFVDRYEGLLVLIAYMTLTFLAFNMVESEYQLKSILVALGLSATLMSLLGLTQFIGKDFLMTNIGKKLILPAQYEHIADSLSFTFAGSRTIYATLYNINYVGVYMSMVFALAASMFLLIEDKKIKLYFLALSIISFGTLLGSNSRAAQLGIIFYLFLAVILFRRELLKRWKAVALAAVIVAVLLIGVNASRGGAIFNRFIAGIKSITTVTESDFEDIILEENKANIVFKDHEMTVQAERNGLLFRDTDGEFIEMDVVDGRIIAKTEPYNKHSFEVQDLDGNAVILSRIMTNRGERVINFVIDDGIMKVLDFNNRDFITDIKAPYVGFEGRELMASSRGYIWSRTIPMLKETMIIGHGPDTYALHFPHRDFVGKFLAFDNVNMIVDKPHNIYLQTAINTGLLSLISLLIIWGMYAVSSLKLYFSKVGYSTFTEAAGLSIFMAVSVYLFTGLSNDSLVSVAPVFWMLLGLGLWSNNKVSELKNEQR